MSVPVAAEPSGRRAFVATLLGDIPDAVQYTSWCLLAKT
jgi:hypothetical protein